MNLTSQVTSAFKHVPLIDYLATRFNYLPRTEWLKRINEKRFVINGAVGTATMIVTQGDVVVYDVPPFPQPDADFNYTVIYEDKWLVAVNKPSNLRVHGEGRFMMANLVYQMRENGYPMVTTVHRLDADTSGVVVLAKDRQTAGLMGKQFEARTIHKQYAALVNGIPLPLADVIDRPIGKVDNPIYAGRGRIPRSWVDVPHAKVATTHYETVETFRAVSTPYSHDVRDYAFLRLKPITGRTHQLRVHLAAIGHIIVGDRLYKLDDAAYVDWRENRHAPQYADWLTRHALHCSAMIFTHPHTEKSCTIKADLATDITTVCKQMRSCINKNNEVDS